MDLGLDSTGQAVAPIVACAFKLRWDSMLNDNARFHVLGPCLGYVGAIEWQGRGLPHGHVTVWLAGEGNAETLWMCVCVCVVQIRCVLRSCRARTCFHSSRPS